MEGVPVDHQVIRIEVADQAGDLPRPLRRRVEFVARLPAENGWIVCIANAGDGVRAADDMLDRPLEVGDHVWIGPEGFGGLAAKPCVLRGPSLPLPVVDQRHDHADSLAARRGEHAVHRDETLLVELTRSGDMHERSHVGVVSPHRDHVAPGNRAPHLPHRPEGIGELEGVRPPPRCFPPPGKCVFHDEQVRHVERHESHRSRVVTKRRASAPHEPVHRQPVTTGMTARHDHADHRAGDTQGKMLHGNLVRSNESRAPPQPCLRRRRGDSPPAGHTR